MRERLVLVALAALSIPSLVSAQLGPDAASAEPFKLGTFEVDGLQTIGIVLRDQLIVELDAANEELQRDPAYPNITMPEDMKSLIGQYEYGLKYRLYEIVTDLVNNASLDADARPSFVHDVGNVRTLAPLMPGKMLNAAVNFYSHVEEANTPEEQRAAAERRRATRGIPYLFIKPTAGAVIGQGDAVVIPYGRDRIDWEVELAIVIGRTAKYVSAADAEDYVFGYLVSIDVSDRGGRPPGGYSSGSDWFVGKGHDTFAPEGPWIVPKEFYGDPMERLHQVLTIDGVTVQEAEAGDMIHSLWELIEYGSSIITLYPGDVLNSGTSGGTAATATTERGQSGYLQAGETIEATIEGIGTLRMPVVAGPPLPDDLTGSFLPAVRTYRNRR